MELDCVHGRELGDQGQKAYEIVLDAIGGPSYLDHCKYELIVCESSVLSESSFYQDLFENEKSYACRKNSSILQT